MMKTQLHNLTAVEVKWKEANYSCDVRRVEFCFLPFLSVNLLFH
jgi:phage host-nuclease inhibitor protein Gam